MTIKDGRAKPEEKGPAGTEIAALEESSVAGPFGAGAIVVRVFDDPRSGLRVPISVRGALFDDVAPLFQGAQHLYSRSPPPPAIEFEDEMAEMWPVGPVDTDLLCLSSVPP